MLHEKELKRKKTAKTFAEYLNYLGQRALFPSESFSSASQNISSSEALNKFEDKLRVDNSYKFYTDGELFEDGTKKIYFKSNARIRIENPDMKTYDHIQGVPSHDIMKTLMVVLEFGLLQNMKKHILAIGL